MRTTKSWHLLLWLQENACVCQPTEKFYISYMNSSTQANYLSYHNKIHPKSSLCQRKMTNTANLLNIWIQAFGVYDCVDEPRSWPNKLSIAQKMRKLFFFVETPEQAGAKYLRDFFAATCQLFFQVWYFFQEWYFSQVWHGKAWWWDEAECDKPGKNIIVTNQT